MARYRPWPAGGRKITARGTHLVGAIVVGFSALAVAAAPERTSAASSADKPAARLAQVRYIQRGLSVQPPHGRKRRGKKKMALYRRYLLQTAAKQRASIRFRDRTTLHINQRTAAVLRSPHLTYVQGGEVDEVLAPGSNHRIQTAAAVASAIGTNFDIRVRKGRTQVIVAHGAVVVKNRRGKVIVKTNQETTVSPGKKPSQPKPVNAASAIGWTQGIPAPVLGENLALDANGGQVKQDSSQRPGGEAGRANDGRTDTSWETAPGATTNQSITLGFTGEKIFYVTAVLINGSAQKGVSPSTDLKDFAIQYSNVSTDDARANASKWRE